MRRLPDEKIAQIRGLRRMGHSISDICTIARVGRGVAHKYAEGIVLPFGPLKSGPKRKIALNIIRGLRAQGLSVRAIAKRIGCGSTTVFRALKTGKAA